MGKINCSGFFKISQQIRPFGHNYGQEQMFHLRQHDLLCLGPPLIDFSGSHQIPYLSPRDLFGSKKNFTAMLIRSTTRMPQATADRFFRISPNRRFGPLEAYFKPKNFLPQYSANRRLPASGCNGPIFQTFTKSIIWPRKSYSCQTQPRVIAKQLGS